MLGIIDWLIIAAFLLISLGISFYYKSQSSKSLDDFFLGGRNLPWYIAGISMVATTFAADTPLAVTELVASNGISGNWIWWSFLSGGILTTFFFAKLWRRANVLTEVEFIDIRYSGRAAKLLRSFKAVYLGLFMNIIIIGWVNLAMSTILQGLFGIPESTAFIYCGLLMIFVALYASISGLKGIAITDTFQFFIAMGACITLAVLMLNSSEVGGIENLKQTLPKGSLDFFPSISTDSTIATEKTYSIGLWAFVAFFGVVWWASWYPGAEPGGGGYVAQRMMSAKDEENAFWATLFFQIGHYCLRPWPWIIVALCASVIYPLENNLDKKETQKAYLSFKKTDLDPEILKWDQQSFNSQFDQSKSKYDNGNANTNDSLLIENSLLILSLRNDLDQLSNHSPRVKKSLDYTIDARFGFVNAILDFLPKNGLLGLLLVAFLAAYMSTISTQLNWGSSYLVNDLYLPLKKSKSDNKSLVGISRITTILLMVAGLGTTFLLDSISSAWSFILECGAGLGLVLILRWYWWRINAWAEIAATIAPFVGYTVSHYILNIESPITIFISVVFTTMVWVVVMYLTAPTDSEKLNTFYNRVKPMGSWQIVRKRLNLENNSQSLKWLFVSWISATIFVYSTLFTIGKLIFLEYKQAFIFIIAGAFCLAILIYSMKKSENS